MAPAADRDSSAAGSHAGESSVDLCEDVRAHALKERYAGLRQRNGQGFDVWPHEVVKLFRRLIVFALLLDRCERDVVEGDDVLPCGNEGTNYPAGGAQASEREERRVTPCQKRSPRRPGTKAKVRSTIIVCL